MAERQTTSGAGAGSDGITGLPIPTRAQQQESLNDTLRLLNRVVAAAATSIVVTDPHLPDNPIVFHNPAFELISGYTAQEIDGHNCRFLQGPDTDPETVAALRQTIAEGRSGQFLILNYRKDGTPFWNEVSVSPVYDSEGRLTHFVGIQNDVTRRADAEREREELLAQQRQIVDTLQRALLLTPPVSELNGLEIATRYEAAWKEAQFGGDFSDTFALSETRVALVVGDCSGKGLTAAQYTAEVKYALRVLLREYGGHPGPALHRLNAFLTEAQRWDSRDGSALVCVAVAVVDAASGEVTVVSAGMEPPMILRAAARTVEIVEVTGQILGMDASADYQSRSLVLGDGDIFLLTTDGITEARGPRPKREFFGYEGLISAAQRATQASTDLDHISEQIVADTQTFAGNRPQDDICLLLARRLPVASIAQAVPSVQTNPLLPPFAAATLQDGDSGLIALEMAGIGYWELDLVTGTAVRSPLHDRIFGYAFPLPTWSYDQFLQHVHPEDRADVDARYGQALAAENDWDLLFRIRRADDQRVRWIEIRGRNFSQGPSSRRLVGTIADVTDREREKSDRAESERRAERLRVSEERYRLLTLATNQVVWWTDANGSMVQPEPLWSAFTGQTKAEYLGWGWLEAIHPDDRAHVVSVWQAALSEKRLYECRYRLRYRDGSYRETIARGAPILDENLRVTEWIGANADISPQVVAETERRQAEDERAGLVVQLQEANIRQRRFLREMLFGFTEGRLRLCDTEADLPVRLLPADATEPIALTPTSLRPLRRQVTAVAEQLALPPVRVMDLETAVGEAGMNAVRHAGGGEADVCADPATGTVQVWIRDHGAGITEEFIHRALERGWTTGGFGQGFFLIRSCADRVYLLTGPTGTTLVLEQDRVTPEPPWMKGA